METIRRNALAGLLAATCAVACAAAMAAPPDPESHPGKGKKSSSFVRGEANSKVKRQQPPKTEAEAIATKRVVANGIVEMELPEDRMVNLVERTRADGTKEIGHFDLDKPVDEHQEAARE